MSPRLDETITWSADYLVVNYVVDRYNGASCSLVKMLDFAVVASNSILYTSPNLCLCLLSDLMFIASPDLRVVALLFWGSHLLGSLLPCSILQMLRRRRSQG
ncbi:hypothetical protein LX36DRAFT_653952 [Colletotrichum falcatum]|nr:hypothetical protein LX36DRAFT_653952 [Colletotrichum falcatum]